MYVYVDISRSKRTTVVKPSHEPESSLSYLQHSSHVRTYQLQLLLHVTTASNTGMPDPGVISRYLLSSLSMHTNEGEDATSSRAYDNRITAAIPGQSRERDPAERLRWAREKCSSPFHHSIRPVFGLCWGESETTSLGATTTLLP